MLQRTEKEIVEFLYFFLIVKRKPPAQRVVFVLQLIWPGTFKIPGQSSDLFSEKQRQMEDDSYYQVDEAKAADEHKHREEHHFNCAPVSLPDLAGA